MVTWAGLDRSAGSGLGCSGQTPPRVGKATCPGLQDKEQTHLCLSGQEWPPPPPFSWISSDSHHPGLVSPGLLSVNKSP